MNNWTVNKLWRKAYRENDGWYKENSTYHPFEAGYKAGLEEAAKWMEEEGDAVYAPHLRALKDYNEQA